MSVLPNFKSINGSGKPRLLVGTDTIYTSSTNTTFTATSASETGTPAITPVLAGMRVSAVVSGTPNKYTFGKVTSRSTGATGVINVDAWSNGTPTNATAYTIDGWVIDLPYCKELTERFEPDYLIHGLWRGDKGEHIETRFRGWKYVCTLDYSQYVAADTLFALRPALSRDVAKQLTLIPHADQPGFNYEVYILDPVELSRYGRSPGYRKPVFALRGQDNLPSWPLIDGYGMFYGTSYGTHL